MLDPRSQPVAEIVSGDKVLVAQEIHINQLHQSGGTHLPTSRPRQSPPRRLPPRNEKFVGRNKELKKIHNELGRRRPVGVTQQSATYGHGGVGKTALAVEYGWRHLADYPGGVFLVDCAADYLATALAALAGPLGLPEADTPEQTARRVKECLEAGEAALLILDNLSEPVQWADLETSGFLPAGACRRLVTTRAPLLLGMTMLAVERLPRRKGIELLAKFRKDARLDRNRQVVGDIVEWLDGLAVGLTVVGAYLDLHRDVSWVLYAEQLSSKGLGTVRKTEEAVGPLPDYGQRVDSVFDDLLASLSAGERRALEYASLLPEDLVISTWLVTLLGEDGTVTLVERPGYEHPVEAVVAELKRRQLLLPREEDTLLLSLHRVLRQRLLEILDDADGERVARIAKLAVDRGQALANEVSRPGLHWEMTPLLRLSEELEEYGPSVIPARVVCDLAIPLVHLGRQEEVRRPLERALSVTEQRRGQVHTDTAVCLQRLGYLLHSQGELARARPLYERALEICEKELGREHLGTEQCLSGLGTLLLAQGELDRARELLERALAISERERGLEHPQTAIGLYHLGELLQAQGDRGRARLLFERALAISEKELGPEHLFTARCLDKLGSLLRMDGELERARPLLEQALAVHEKVLGQEHRQTAWSLLDLGHSAARAGGTGGGTGAVRACLGCPREGVGAAALPHGVMPQSCELPTGGERGAGEGAAAVSADPGHL